jgi:ABC-type multidrug transport system fused ATPase/permease subunit
MATILLPVSIGKFYALVFGFEGNRAVLLDFLPKTFYDTVSHFLLLFLVLILIYFIANYFRRYLVASTGELLTYELRNRLFAHQIKLATRIYEEKGVGKYLLRYSGDLKSIQNYLTKGIIGFATDVLLIILFLIALATISHLLTLISIVAIVLMIIPISMLNERLHHISVSRRNQKSGLLSFVSQRLEAMISIKAFNREVPEKAKFAKRSQQLFQSGLAFHRLSSFIFVLVPGLLYVMIALIMYAIYWQKASGMLIDQGAFLSAFLLIITMLPVFRRSLRIVVTWKLGLISIKKLQNVLDLPEEDQTGKNDLVLGEASLSLKDVSFRFGENYVFQGISANWSAQGLHLVVGGTGMGKSTLAKLLLGIYPDYEGEIKIDEQDIREVFVKSLRKQVAIISEAYPLLGKTVFEAISYSRKTSKRKGAALLLNKVQQGLPKEAMLSLDDRIGHQAGNLSRGQIRILLVTRALLTRKPILILDEPFANIEPQIKAHLIQLILKLKRKRTIVLMLKHHDFDDLGFDSVLDLDRCRAGGTDPQLKLSFKERLGVKPKKYRSSSTISG